MNELHEIIKRLMFVLGYKTKKTLAKALKISPSDLNNRINSGTIRKLLIDLAIHEEVNVDYILTGEVITKKKIADLQSKIGIFEPHESYLNTVKISDPLIQKTAAILESSTVYSTALRSNIEAFHYAITCEGKLTLANKRIDNLEEQILEIKDRLPAIGES